jgi:hypothetical protein
MSTMELNHRDKMLLCKNNNTGMDFFVEINYFDSEKCLL